MAPTPKSPMAPSSNAIGPGQNESSTSSNVPSNVPTVTAGSVLLLSSLPLGIGAYIGYRQAIASSIQEGGVEAMMWLPGAKTLLPKSQSTAMNTTKNVLNTSTASNASQPLNNSSSNSLLERVFNPTQSTASIQKSVSNSKPLQSTIQYTTKSTIQSTAATISTAPPPLLAARALAIGTLLSLTGTSLLLSCIFYASGCSSVDELVERCRRVGPRKWNDLEIALGANTDTEARKERLEYERKVDGMTEEEELEFFKKRYEKEFDWDEKK